jgi:phosphoglycerate-specific signal transduction histidine kinase
MNERIINEIVQRVLSEAIEGNERECLRAVSEQLQSAKQKLNNALRMLMFSHDTGTDVFKQINRIHNDISHLLESEYM